MGRLHLIPWLIFVLGVASVSLGLMIIYPPALLIVWGAAFIALGLLVDPDRR